MSENFPNFDLKKKLSLKKNHFNSYLRPYIQLNFIAGEITICKQIAGDTF